MNFTVSLICHTILTLSISTLEVCGELAPMHSNSYQVLLSIIETIFQGMKLAISLKWKKS